MRGMGRFKLFKPDVRIFLIPLVGVLMMATSMVLMFIFEYRTFSEIREISLSRTIFILLETFVSIGIMSQVIYYLNEVLPWSKSWWRRFLANFAMLLCFVFAMSIMITWNEGVIFKYLTNMGTGEIPKEMRFVMPVVTNTLFMTLIELLLQFETQSELKVKLARLEKEKINSQYSALKGQLDHHFLFNNLSVLSSIIYEDVEKADSFIQEFSNVYRYVLQINEKDLVTVEEELNFIDAYLYLFKSRFEEGFQYQIEVKQDDLQKRLPPLSLQVLVENAIKHNAIAKSKPMLLKIITTANGQLKVINTFQPRAEKVSSTSTGQRNLREKFLLLNMEAPLYERVNGDYVATLSLINKQND